jgi:ABC-type phosphate/phosphonate transport system substrate-binding protein
MAALRAHSFLGDLSAPHYAAVAALAARAVGLEPVELAEPPLDSLAEVLAEPGPALLFLCGLPYVRAHDRGVAVEAIAAGVPTGEPGPYYYADVVVRAGLRDASLEQLVGARIGVNGRDSLSGYVLPSASLAARGQAASLFDDMILTGSHRRSLAMLVAGELDAAAIDSTLLTLQSRANPAIAALPVLERLGPAPIPPVVLLGGDPELARALRDAFAALDASEEGRRALALGAVARYVAVEDRDYDPVRALDGAVR